MSTTNIIGRKIKGFEFPHGTDGVSWNEPGMRRWVGVIGRIDSVKNGAGDVPHAKVVFEDSVYYAYWSYPLSLIEQHLVPEEKPAINSDQTLTQRCSLHWDEPCDGGSNCNTVCWIQSGNKGRMRRMHYAAYAIGDVTYSVSTQQYSLTIYGENGDMIFYGQDANEVDSRAQSFVNAEAYRGENERLRAALERIANWELPETGETSYNGLPLSYEACYGSNGARDYMRQLARAALSPTNK